MFNKKLVFYLFFIFFISVINNNLVFANATIKIKKNSVEWFNYNEYKKYNSYNNTNIIGYYAGALLGNYYINDALNKHMPPLVDKWSYESYYSSMRLLQSSNYSAILSFIYTYIECNKENNLNNNIYLEDDFLTEEIWQKESVEWFKKSYNISNLEELSNALKWYKIENKLTGLNLPAKELEAIKQQEACIINVKSYYESFSGQGCPNMDLYKKRLLTCFGDGANKTDKFIQNLQSKLDKSTYDVGSFCPYIDAAEEKRPQVPKGFSKEVEKLANEYISLYPKQLPEKLYSKNLKKSKKYRLGQKVNRNIIKLTDKINYKLSEKIKKQNILYIILETDYINNYNIVKHNYNKAVNTFFLGNLYFEKEQYQKSSEQFNLASTYVPNSIIIMYSTEAEIYALINNMADKTELDIKEEINKIADKYEAAVLVYSFEACQVINASLSQNLIERWWQKAETLREATVKNELTKEKIEKRLQKIDNQTFYKKCRLYDNFKGLSECN